MSIRTQTAFADALRNPDMPAPQGLTSWNLPQPERRFAVYRNNMTAGLTAALASRFPAAIVIVGEDFFTALAQAFIALHPPRSPLLLTYGDTLADFVETFEPAAGLSYLPDVLRLEAARGRAYHAADYAVLDGSMLAKVDAESLPGLIFELHPSVSIVRSRFPAVTIWAMNAGDMPLGPIEDWTAEDALVVRPQMAVFVHRLPPGAASFLQSLGAGLCFADAAQRAMADTPDFDLAASLAIILTAGALASVR